MALIQAGSGDDASESQPQQVSMCPAPKGGTDTQQCVVCDGEPWIQIEIIESFQIGNKRFDRCDVM